MLNIIKYATVSSCLFSSGYLLGAVHKDSLFTLDWQFSDEAEETGIERQSLLDMQLPKGTKIGRQFLLNRRLRDAAEAGNSGEVQECLRLGADPNARDDGSGDTSLFLAVIKDDPAIVEILFKGGAVWSDPNAPMVHFAAKAGSLNVVRMLVRTGHNWHILDGRNQTAKDKAVIRQSRLCGQLDHEAQNLERELAGLPPDCRAGIEQNSAARLSAARLNYGECPLPHKCRNGFCRLVNRHRAKVDQVRTRIDQYEEIIQLFQ